MHVLPDDVEKPPYATSPVPSNLGDLKFNPLDVYNLRRFIGALPESPGAYTKFRAHFDAADIAFFAAGCATDGKHAVGKDKFHPMVQEVYSCKYGSFGYESRKKLRDRVQALTFDMAALWDRAFGGSTIVIHVEGAHQPKVPNIPENIRAAVYLPPSTVVEELPDAHEAIAFIVQAFIEQVGVPTIDRWTAAAKKHLNFSLTMSGNSRGPIKSYTSFIPPPVKLGHAHYMFQGLPSHTATLGKPSGCHCNQVQGRDSPDGHYDLDTITKDEAYEIRIIELEADYQDQISSLGTEVMQCQERIISLEDEITRLNTILTDQGLALSTRSSPRVHPANFKTPSKATKTFQNVTPTRNRTGSPAQNFDSPNRAYLSTPTKVSPSPFAFTRSGHSSGHSSATCVNPDLPNCERVLFESGSDANLLAVIPVILRNTLPQFWHRELINSGLSDVWADEMVKAMTTDT